MRQLAIFSIVALVAAGPAGAAGGDPIKLGSIPRYGDESAAKAACAPHGVVWADAQSGFFYPKFHPDYGKSAHGADTCYSKAKKADYWNSRPRRTKAARGVSFRCSFCSTCTLSRKTPA